jgi:hypothetical protein
VLVSGAILSAIAWIFFALIFEIFFPNLSERQVGQGDKASSLFAVMFGLFAGANVYLKIYDYVNHRSQIRDWQHDYALRNMEEVYAPIWEEITGMLRRIERFEDPEQWKPLLVSGTGTEGNKYGFKEVMASHLGLFIDFDTKQRVEKFLDAVSEYQKEHPKMWNTLYEEANKKAKEIGDRIGLRDSSILSQAIIPNNLVVLDPEMSRRQIVGGGSLEDYVAKLFINNHKIKSESEPSAKTDFAEYIAYLRGLQVCKTMRLMRDECFERGNFAFARLREIVEDPSRVRPSTK